MSWIRSAEQIDMEMQSLTLLQTIFALIRRLGWTFGRAMALFLADTTFPRERPRIGALGLIVACWSLALSLRIRKVEIYPG